MINCAI